MHRGHGAQFQRALEAVYQRFVVAHDGVLVGHEVLEAVHAFFLHQLAHVGGHLLAPPSEGHMKAVVGSRLFRPAAPLAVGRAAVAVKKSSAVTVPRNGSCMWVWGSRPPGRMSGPLASRVCAPAGACAAASAPSATMRRSTHSRWAGCSRSALTTVPPRITRA